ncbi:hypothetical protein D3C87_2014740 [compost metagenome]
MGKPGVPRALVPWQAAQLSPNRAAPVSRTMAISSVSAWIVAKSSLSMRLVQLSRSAAASVTLRVTATRWSTPNKPRK